ncbi:polysaccharide deacetylase family protein [Haloarchaeobius sp. DFWS5]|uniref:polysaccharide deacetylase family protein n=1 Tax=Haloarchaeobius sp. DFWS5 TaxID=3446114 RepID=UPI003EBE935D
MGTVTISIDAELGWGFHFLEDRPPTRIENARSGWMQLIDLLSTFDVPATWAVVGHLYIDGCDGNHGDHPLGESWFEIERDEWAARPNLRFGRDLVTAVRESGVGHELGCHTFSHVVMGEDYVTHDVAIAELERSVDAATAAGFERPRSFVYPWNSVAHRDTLAATGFTCYRGQSPRTLSPLQKVRSGTIGTLTPPLVRPEVDEFGLVNVPASQFLFEFEWPARGLVEPRLGDPVVARAKAGIDAAATAEDDAVFHMWLHPNNITSYRDVTRLRAILAYLDDRRESVSIQTMGDVAERVRSRTSAATRANPTS